MKSVSNMLAGCIKVGHDVQAQTILKVKLVGWLVFIGSSFYECNDIFDTSRIWLLVSGKDQNKVIFFQDNFDLAGDDFPTV